MISRKAGKKWVTTVTAPKVPIRWRAPGRQALGSRATQVRVGKDLFRRGTVTISNVGGRLRVVANLRVHDEYLPYLQTVPTSWLLQAQRAMAIIARSSALAAVWNPDCGCHVGDADSVVSRPPRQGFFNWRKAVNSTSSSDSGLSVLYADKPVSVPVFEATGGSDPEQRRCAGEDLPWARSASDPWSLKKKNTLVRELATQTRPQSQVGLTFRPARRRSSDLRTRMTGAQSPSRRRRVRRARQLDHWRTTCGPFCSRRRSTLRAATTRADHRHRTVRDARASWGRPVVVQATDTTVVALAASREPRTGRCSWWAARVRGRRLESDTTSIPADRSGGLYPTGLKSLSRLAKVKRVTAKKATSLSPKLAKLNSRDSRRTVFVASPAIPRPWRAQPWERPAPPDLYCGGSGREHQDHQVDPQEREANHRSPARRRSRTHRRRCCADPSGWVPGPHPALSADRRPGVASGEAILVDVTRPMGCRRGCSNLAKRSCSCRPRPAMPRRCGSYRPARRSPRYAQ